MLLADLGADVIKVERPGEGDETRSWGPPFAGVESAYFLAVNRGKRSVALDLARPDAQEALWRLAATADVVVENFRQGTAERLGAGYERLARENPKLVYCSITGFGDARPGYDFVAQAESGLMSVTGIPGHGPLRVGIPIADLCGGIFAAYGVTVALLEREASGKGQWVQTSLLEAMIYMMDFQNARWTVDGEVPGQAGNFHPTSIPTGVYKTKDGHINIAVFGGKIWERFCEAIGAPEWIQDERSATKVNRHHNREWLNVEIEKHLARETSDYWVKAFNDAGVAGGHINDMKQALEHEQVQHLGMVQEVTSPRLGRQRLVGQPIIMSRTPSKIARATPKRGEHTEEILAELGFDAQSLQRMKAEGVY